MWRFLHYSDTSTMLDSINPSYFPYYNRVQRYASYTYQHLSILSLAYPMNGVAVTH